MSERKKECDVTYEELARMTAGDLSPERGAELKRHALGCEACRRRLDALRDVDDVLGVLPREEPSARAVLEARRLISSELRGSGGPEVLTLREVAEFLRVSPDEMDRLAGDLPAFEIAGNIRVRRARLIEWIERRERGFLRTGIESEAARLIAGVTEENGDEYPRGTFGVLEDTE